MLRTVELQFCPSFCIPAARGTMLILILPFIVTGAEAPERPPTTPSSLPLPPRGFGLVSARTTAHYWSVNTATSFGPQFTYLLDFLTSLRFA